MTSVQSVAVPRLAIGVDPQADETGSSLLAVLSAMLLAVRSGFPDSAVASKALSDIDALLLELQMCRPELLAEIVVQISHVTIGALLELEREDADSSAEERLRLIGAAYGIQSQ